MRKHERLTFNLAELGRANRAELYNAVERANNAQGSFFFNLLKGTIAFDENKYLQPNRGHDLDTAITDLLPSLAQHTPITVITELPYTDQESRKKDDWYFFWDLAHEDDAAVSIVSTYLWQQLTPKRPLESYLLLFFATIALRRLVSLSIHTDTRGCLMDFCDEPQDIEVVLRAAGLCDECSYTIEGNIKSGRMSSAQAADVRRLLHRAAGLRYAFLAFPFKTPFVELVEKVIAPSLRDSGWRPTTAADTESPRDITDAIRRGIRISDLIVADVTGRNPNVYWEFGFAYALGKDHILLSQNRRLPFDIAAHRCIFYSLRDDRGRDKLAADLRRHLRPRA